MLAHYSILVFLQLFLTLSKANDVQPSGRARMQPDTSQNSTRDGHGTLSNTTWDGQGLQYELEEEGQKIGRVLVSWENSTGKKQVTSLSRDSEGVTTPWGQANQTDHDADITAEPSFWEYRLSTGLLGYGGLVIAVTGVVGNTLSIAVLVQNPPLSSTSLYLINLAVVDMGVNVIGQLLRTVPMGFKYDTATLHPWACKLWIYFNHALSAISSWILVAVTVERTLVVYLPLKAKVICTRRASKIIIGVTNMFLGGMFVHFFWAYGWAYKDEPDSEEPHLMSTCTVTVTHPAYIYYMRFIRPWQNFVVLFAGPFLCLFLCNILILRKLFEGQQARKSLAETPTGDKSQMRSITVMLLTVSFMYLVCTSPLQILYLVDKADPLGWTITTREQALIHLRWACAVDLKFLNHAINFILYCISGEHFRKSLRHLVANCCSARNPPTSAYVVGSDQPSTISSGV